MSQQEQSASSSDGGQGFTGRLQRLLGHGLALLQNRLELLSTELEAEKLRLLSALAQGLIALLLGAAAVGMLSLALLLLTPERWRWLTALVLCVIYLSSAWLLWRAARQQLQQPGGLFAASVEELARDRNALGS